MRTELCDQFGIDYFGEGGRGGKPRQRVGCARRH